MIAASGDYKIEVPSKGALFDYDLLMSFFLFLGGMYARTAGLFSVSERVADFCRTTCSVHPSISTLVAAFQFQKLSILSAPIAAAM